MKKKISVAMATYNGGKYLREQLDSLYSQTVLPDEIVVSDDCSNDNTIVILDEYKKRYGLKYQINNQRLGLNKNFEKAILLCSGDYVALCDQDDIWFPYKLERSYNKIITLPDRQPSLVSSVAIEVDANLNILYKRNVEPDTISYHTTLLGHKSQGCSLIMNRELIDLIIPFPNDDSLIYDLYIGLIATMTGCKYNIGEPLMYYRFHTSNLLAKINFARVPLLEKVKNKYTNRYPGLIPEERFGLMRYIADHFQEHFIKERIPLYNKLLSLNEKGIFQSIRIILSIRELSLTKRFEIVINTIISWIFDIGHK